MQCKNDRSEKERTKERVTWTCAEGEGEVRVSEKEAIPHMKARIVIAKVSKAFAL